MRQRVEYHGTAPGPFQEFLRSQVDQVSGVYGPARFWDYLRVNFEPAILASGDGHRWAVASDAIERVEARFQEPHVSLIKTVALVDIFRNGSGVAATNNVLFQSVPGYSEKDLAAALADLSQSSVAVYRKHLSAWAIYAGSDFDIELAVEQAKEKRTLSIDQQFKQVGSRSTSRVCRLHSGSSSRNSTPLCASEISPGRGYEPPPTSDTALAVWWGAR